MTNSIQFQQRLILIFHRPKSTVSILCEKLCESYLMEVTDIYQNLSRCLK